MGRQFTCVNVLLFWWRVVLSWLSGSELCLPFATVWNFACTWESLWSGTIIGRKSILRRSCTVYMRKLKGGCDPVCFYQLRYFHTHSTQVKVRFELDGLGMKRAMICFYRHWRYYQSLWSQHQKTFIVVFLWRFTLMWKHIVDVEASYWIAATFPVPIVAN